MTGKDSRNKEVTRQHMKIKVIIADDNSFIREGLKIILSTYEEFEVLDTVNDGNEAVDYCLKA